jgi:hypothetical protein
MFDTLICLMLVDAVVAVTLVEVAVLVAWHAATGRGLGAADLVANVCAGLCLLGALRSVLEGSAWPVCALWLAAAGAAHATDLVRRGRAAAVRTRAEGSPAVAPSSISR